jgi:hypothetical protein
MDVEIVANPSARHQWQHGLALQDGLRVHGVRARLLHRHEAVASDTVAVWGWRTGVQHRRAGRNVLVMERGYLGDRFVWSSLGWNGLNGHARFGRGRGNRFEQHFGHLRQPWRTGGDYVLIVGQVPGDAALRGRDLRPWYAEQATAAARYGLPVRFRPHPLAARRTGGRFDVPGAPQLSGELAEALQGAALVVTFNSNTAVESLLAGRPTVAMDDGSMAWGVALRELPASLDADEPSGRAEWLDALAWTQWTLDEIASGAAWEVVRTVP